MFDLGNRAKPVLKWAGGKSGLLSQLIEHFPLKFSRLVEPFLGGGAVFFSLRSGVPSLLNDANPEIINLYSVITENPLKLAAELDNLASRYSESFYYELRSELPNDRVKKAARTLFLNKTGFNGLYRQNSKGGFNVPFGKRALCPALYDIQNLNQVSTRLSSAELRNDDFETVVNQAAEGDFVYCDPPYEPLSPTSSFNAYTGGGFSQNDQTRLKNACARAASRGAVVAVSNSSANFIKQLYSEWDVRTVLARRAINSKGAGRGEIEEVLILLDSSHV